MSLAQPSNAIPAFDAGIFREYDIRGIAGVNFSAEHVYAIARAFAETVRDTPEARICLARDGRISSPALLAAACQGVSDAGVEAVVLGLGPTPMLYHAAYKLPATGGIMITGSHNPPDHNGMKFVRHNQPFYGDMIKALGQRAAQNFLPVTTKGAITQHEYADRYVQELIQAFDSERYAASKQKLRVAWDAGNGAAGEIMAALCSRLPGEHRLLNAEIDGTFPAHHPDPTVPANLKQLMDTVLAEKLDCGIAFDGDGDRIGVVDDEGAILWGDQLLMLYAAEILKHAPGATVIADVKASGALFEEIARLGGTPLMWKTGHSLIKSKMQETGALLAGEMSGHLFFRDSYYGFDDALYAAVRLLNLLTGTGKKLSDLRKALPQRVNTPEIRFECADERKFMVIEEVKTRLKSDKAEFSDVDGVRVATADGWWLLRASNTQPMLVARCESTEPAGLERLKKALQAQLKLSDVTLPA